MKQRPLLPDVSGKNVVFVACTVIDLSGLPSLCMVSQVCVAFGYISICQLPVGNCDMLLAIFKT